MTAGVDTSVWPPRYDPAYRPDPTADCWFPELECLSPETREALILDKLRRQVAWAWERSPFYRRKWDAAGVSPATLRSLEDLAKFPVVQKVELRLSQAAAPPYGEYLCIEPGEVARIHGTSGTTGRPTVFGIGSEDWARIGEAHARILWAAGLRPDDRVLICSFFSLYLGSWGALRGVERLGATAFPFGAGVPGQTLMAVEWAQALKPTAFYGTPSYALHFAETARREGLDPRTFGFRTLFFSGEPGAGIPATKRLIEETFGGRCMDMGSMAEMTPWMTNAECRHRTGMHLWQDLVYTQVCAPDTFAPLPFGAEGTLRAIDGFGGEFRVIVSRRETMDELLIRAEYAVSHADPARLAKLSATATERLRARLGVHPVVELVPEGTLPRTEFKARRVIDDRDLYRRALQEVRR